jgi:hypothetical protein
MDNIDLFLVSILLIGILIFTIRRLKGSQTHKAWSQLAAQHNLTYDHQYDLLGKAFPRGINGAYRSRKVSMAYITEREEEYTNYYIRIWIEIKASYFWSLWLSEKDSFSRISDEYIKPTGYRWDADFDRRFQIWSEPESFATKVFSSSELRRKLLEGQTPSFTVSSKKAGIESRMARLERDLEYWQSVLDNLCNVAEAVENAIRTGYYPTDQSSEEL